MSTHALDQPSTEPSTAGPAAPTREPDGTSHVEIVGGRARQPAARNSHAEAGQGVPSGEAATSEELTVISQRAASPHRASSVAKLRSGGPAVHGDPADAALEGATLGHFRLEQFVGGGGMGSVFRGTDLRLGRTVAVKILARNRTEPDTLRRFENEAQSAARLDHKNIARVYYVGEDRGQHYIVFEFIEGTNIRDLVDKNGPLSIEEAICYVLQIADALEHASQRHVVHRDIKPSNILVTADGHAKLVDLGLARLRMESDRNDLTASGVTLGTFDYISPEQARDPRDADVRSDLYSLGCTFYFMLTGQPPFPDGTLLQKLLSHSSAPPPDPRSIRPDLDDQVAGIIHTLLAKQPKDRFQEPSELVDELYLVAERLNLTDLHRDGPVRTGPTRSIWTHVERATPWLLPIVLLFASVLALERVWFRDEIERMPDSEPAASASGKPDGHRPNTAHRRARASRPETTSPDGSSPATAEGAAPTKPAAVNRGSEPAANATNQAVSAHDRTVDATAPPAPADGSPDAPLADRTTAPQSDATPAVQAPSQPPPKQASPNQALPDSAEASSVERDARTDRAGRGGADDTTAPPVSSADAAGSSAERVHEGPTAPAGAAPGAAASADGGMAPGDSAATAPPAAAPIRRILVGATDDPPPADATIARSLAAACRAAAASGIDTIELRYNGVREEQPFEITCPKLKIRSGPGFQPVVVFRPGLDDLANERRMIRINGGSLEWSGVQLRLEAPAQPTDAWSLFALQTCEMFELQDSLVTIGPANDDGPLPPDRVSVLEWSRPPSRGAAAATAGDEPVQRTIPPYIGLSNCMIRGQAALVRCERAIPLRISARQCLIVLTDGLLEVHGRQTQPTQLDARIELTLRHVTVLSNKDLCRLNSDWLAPFQLDLVTDYKDSILYLTDSEAALIARTGVRDAAGLAKRLYVRGRDNFYPGSTLLLRVTPADGQATAITFGFMDRNEAWFQEESPRFTLMWKSAAPPPRPLEQHVPSDYLLTNNDYNPAWSGSDEPQAGVDVATLPMDFADGTVHGASGP